MKIDKIFNVAGLNCVVTGGAGGIGLGIAEGMAENGAIVTILDLNADLLNAEVKRLTDLGLKVYGEVASITDRPSLNAAFERAAARTGKLDVCFANAGYDPGPGFSDGAGGRKSIGEIENLADEIWDKSMDVNLTGVFNTIKAATKHMKPSGKGSIIVTTSISSQMVGGMVSSSYMPAKAGAAHLVRQISLDVARYGIRLNSIAPGGFITNIGGGHTKNPEVQEMFGKMIPLGRMVHPQEMQGLAIFLASDASSHITGAEIVIDGGMLNGMAQ